MALMALEPPVDALPGGASLHAALRTLDEQRRCALCMRGAGRAAR